MMEMTKANLAMQQMQKDVERTGTGGEALAAMEGALNELTATGKGDFDTIMKQVASTAPAANK